MDYKNNTNNNTKNNIKNNKNEIIKSLSELEMVFNTNIDCSINPKLCKFSTLLSQTINKTLLYLENDKLANTKNNTVLDIPDRNIDFEQLSKLNNKQ